MKWVLRVFSEKLVSVECVLAVFSLFYLFCLYFEAVSLRLVVLGLTLFYLASRINTYSVNLSILEVEQV